MAHSDRRGRRERNHKLSGTQLLGLLGSSREWYLLPRHDSEAWNRFLRLHHPSHQALLFEMSDVQLIWLKKVKGPHGGSEAATTGSSSLRKRTTARWRLMVSGSRLHSGCETREGGNKVTGTERERPFFSFLV